MNLTNDCYTILIGTDTWKERYYRDSTGWVKVSARGRPGMATPSVIAPSAQTEPRAVGHRGPMRAACRRGPCRPLCCLVLYAQGRGGVSVQNQERTRLWD